MLVATLPTVQTSSVFKALILMVSLLEVQTDKHSRDIVAVALNIHEGKTISFWSREWNLWPGWTPNMT